MSTLHSSYFPQLTASKRSQTALNQMEQLHLKWRVPLFKDPALLFPPTGLLAHLLERKKNSKSAIRIHFAGLFSAIFRLIALASQCCLKRSVCSFYEDKLSQRSLLWKLGNCQHTFSGISLKKKKKTDEKEEKKREQKHFIVLYIWKYMSEYWKMYMLTNLWQNILCKAQYLKLQYFWFLKQTWKKHISRTSKCSPCIASGAVNANTHCRRDELQRRPAVGHKWTRKKKCVEGRLWRRSSSDVQLLQKAVFTSASDPAHVHASSSHISTLCRTESCSKL